MKYVLIALLFLPFFSLGVIHASSLILYYNGTIIAHIEGEKYFNFVGENVSNIIVYGTKYNLTKNSIYFYNDSNVTLEYNAILKKGVIYVNEPYDLQIRIFLPINSSIDYINPTPTSFQIIGKFYYITFNSSNTTILYTTNFSENNLLENKNNTNILYIIISMIASNSVLGFLIYKVRKSESKHKMIVNEIKSETNVELPKDYRLNDRDLLVLKAIKEGKNTLSEIMKYTNLPKTTAYRRVKKLISLGYVTETKKDGKIFYIPKEDK